MKTWLKVLIVTILITIPAFLAGPNAPLGGFWGVDPHGPQPTGGQIPLFMLLGLLDALFLGLGVSFLVFGYPLVAALGVPSKGLALAAYLSIAWLLVQWWPHDNLHISAGDNLQAILAIDYIFHVPIMIASLIIISFFVTVLRARTGAAQPSQEPAHA